jgi:stearoyl-CoA desaturase (delta-9 desaturase)
MTEAYFPRDADDRIAWAKCIPFLIMHALALATPFLVGISWGLVALALASYYARMLFVCTAYHRYFAHRTFKTGRVYQFIMAFLASTATQKGILWWASHHRRHHKYSDLPGDVHSPLGGFFWSHMGWVMSDKYEATDYDRIRDFAKYPELVWLNKWWIVPTVAYAVVLWLIGSWPWLMWGFFLSTVVLWHGTFTVNSIAHVWGKRRYATPDTSRNNGWFMFITLGEGWHNNHHYFQAAANQGFFWWEVDVAYYYLLALKALGIVWDVKTPPKHVLGTNLIERAASPASRPAPQPAPALPAASAREAA